MLRSPSSRLHPAIPAQDRMSFSLSTRAGFLMLLMAVILGLYACQRRPAATPPALTLPPAATLTPGLSPTLTPSPVEYTGSTIVFPKIDRSPRPATFDDWAPWAGRTLTA